MVRIASRLAALAIIASLLLAPLRASAQASSKTNVYGVAYHSQTVVVTVPQLPWWAIGIHVPDLVCRP